MKYRMIRISKALLGGYVITFIILLALSFGLYKFNISNMIVNIGIIISYALSCFLGGLYLAAKEDHKKIIWGLLFGILYYLILIIASLIINKGSDIHITEAIRSLIICTLAGIAGGFASP